MKQVFVLEEAAQDRVISLDDAQAHHIFDVLRTTEKETIRIAAPNGVFLGSVLEKPQILCREKLQEKSSGPAVTLCAALIKQDKFEWLLQKAAELNVSRIVPFTSRNTVVDLKPEKAAKKMDRWNKILEGACRQSNRSTLVELCLPVDIKDLHQYQSQINVLAYEKEDGTRLCQILDQPYTSVTAVIGCEGGFTQEEAALLQEQGFAAAGLGNTILRAETAACYVLSAIDYQFFLNEIKSQ